MGFGGLIRTKEGFSVVGLTSFVRVGCNLLPKLLALKYNI